MEVQCRTIRVTRRALRERRPLPRPSHVSNNKCKFYPNKYERMETVVIETE